MQIQDSIKKTGYYRIRVLPNQSKTELRDVMADGTIKIGLKAVPEKGKANKALIDFLAQELSIPKSSVSITQGLTSREKVVHVDYP